MKRQKREGQLKKMYAVVIIACCAAFALLVAVWWPSMMQARVTGLTLKQEGLNIVVTWDEMECRGYNLVADGNWKYEVREDLKKERWVIKDIEPDEKYTVAVSAVMNSGEETEASIKEIETTRLKQTVKTDIEEYDGFKGDTFKINASGKGRVSFSSDNSRIATVTQKGKVKITGEGHTFIKVKTEGNEIYRPGMKKIRVNSYPEELDQTEGLSVKYISDTRARISWKETDFATGYVLMKKNAATGKLEKLKKVKDGKTSVEITRNDGKYAVKPVAVIKDRKLTGPASETIKVKGTGAKAKSYSSNTIIKKLDGTNLRKFRDINGDGNTNVPQSMSMRGDCYVVSYVNQGGSAGKLISYRKSDGKCMDITACSNMGHANGTTYDPNKDKFYVVKTHQNIRTASCSTYDGKTKASAGTFNLPRVTSGIAYDESNNRYYLSKGNEIYVCTSDFKVKKFIHKFIRYNHAQDIGAYNGVVLVCTWVNGDTSYIDMYRTSDGAYLGSYDVSIGEIESCLVDDGYLVILMNTRGSSKDRIYITKERIAIP